MMNRAFAATRLSLVLMGVLGAAFIAPSAVAAEAFEQFFGRFEGQAVVDGDGDAEPDDELSERDLTVRIGPSEDGFYVEWVALIPKPGARTKRVAFKVPFRVTRRDNIYASAMKMDMFGHAVPLDPLKGNPYIWARIIGNVLTVYSMHVTDDGGYEMQMHRRELNDGALRLTYSRVRDGKVMRTVSGTLKRTD